LLAELDPQTIDKDTEADRGIAAVVGSRKARLWDAYVARWQAKQRSEKGGLIDAFMQVFAQYYDERRLCTLIGAGSTHKTAGAASDVTRPGSMLEPLGRMVLFRAVMQVTVQCDAGHSVRRMKSE